jgi:hypothetical protein
MVLHVAAAGLDGCSMSDPGWCSGWAKTVVRSGLLALHDSEGFDAGAAWYMTPPQPLICLISMKPAPQVLSLQVLAGKPAGSRRQAAGPCDLLYQQAVLGHPTACGRITHCAVHT